MLDKIKGLFKKGLEYTHTAGLLQYYPLYPRERVLLQQIGNITTIIDAQYMKDTKGKNAAIDAVCEILQSYKDDASAAIAKTEMGTCKEDENAFN